MSDPPSEPRRQRLDLPFLWLSIDRLVLSTTRIGLFIIGGLFTGLIVLEVVSRYLADFSIFFINGAAQFLLVWFFLLGAGLGLREGAHVGVAFLANALSTKSAAVLHAAAQALTFVFFLQMLWSSMLALPASWDQVEASTGLSLFWATLSFPVGFALLIYHQLAIVASVMRARRGAAA